MKNNGFTLFEMIIVIGVLAGFMSIFLVNFSSENKRINSKQNDTMTEQVKDAAETYVAVNKDNEEAKYDTLRKVINDKSCLQISIDTLEEEGFIVENVISASFKNKYPNVKFYYDNSSQLFKYDIGTCP